LLIACHGARRVSCDRRVAFRRPWNCGESVNACQSARVVVCGITGAVPCVARSVWYISAHASAADFPAFVGSKSFLCGSPARSR